MKTLIKIAAVAAMLGLVGCGDENNKYKSQTIFTFVEGCTNGGGNVEACSCLMDGIMKVMPFEEFIEADTAMSAGGEMPKKLTKAMSKARTECQ